MKFTGIKTMTIRRIADDVPIAEVYVGENAEVGLASFDCYIEELTPGSETFDEAKRVAVDAVNFYAAKIRGQYMSVGHGIEIIYMHKDMEAQAYTAAGTPDLADGAQYPFIYEEATALGITPQEVATRILARSAALASIGSKMEGARMIGMKELDATTDLPTLAAAKRDALVRLSVYG